MAIKTAGKNAGRVWADILMQINRCAPWWKLYFHGYFLHPNITLGEPSYFMKTFINISK